VHERVADLVFVGGRTHRNLFRRQQHVKGLAGPEVIHGVGGDEVARVPGVMGDQEDVDEDPQADPGFDPGPTRPATPRGT